MRIRGAVALACAALLTIPAAASAADRTLERYAEGTWASLAAMTDPASGLPTDQLHAEGIPAPQAGLQQSSRVELSERVEVLADVADTVRALETGLRDDPPVARLRADDEDVFHSRSPRVWRWRRSEPSRSSHSAPTRAIQLIASASASGRRR